MSLLFDRRGSVTLQHPWQRLLFRQVEVSARDPIRLVVTDLDGDEISVEPERVIRVELEPSTYRTGRTPTYRRTTKLE